MRLFAHRYDGDAAVSYCKFIPATPAAATAWVAEQAGLPGSLLITMRNSRGKIVYRHDNERHIDRIAKLTTAAA
jgi:hypothetical protein